MYIFCSYVWDISSFVFQQTYIVNKFCTFWKCIFIDSLILICTKGILSRYFGIIFYSQEHRHILSYEVWKVRLAKYIIIIIILLVFVHIMMIIQWLTFNVQKYEFFDHTFNSSFKWSKMNKIKGERMILPRRNHL